VRGADVFFSRACRVFFLGDTLTACARRQRLGIELGPSTPWCKALACAYRAMGASAATDGQRGPRLTLAGVCVCARAGCPDPTYRVEATIIKATGNSESCAETLGLDQCDQVFSRATVAASRQPPAR
jgi:hypothetical protein